MIYVYRRCAYYVLYYWIFSQNSDNFTFMFLFGCHSCLTMYYISPNHSMDLFTSFFLTRTLITKELLESKELFMFSIALRGVEYGWTYSKIGALLMNCVVPNLFSKVSNVSYSIPSITSWSLLTCSSVSFLFISINSTFYFFLPFTIYGMLSIIYYCVYGVHILIIDINVFLGLKNWGFILLFIKFIYYHLKL